MAGGAVVEVGVLGGGDGDPQRLYAGESGVWGPCPMHGALAAPRVCLGGQWGAGVGSLSARRFLKCFHSVVTPPVARVLRSSSICCPRKINMISI